MTAQIYVKENSSPTQNVDFKKENYSNRQISKILACVPQTIDNEIGRGTISQLKRQTKNEKVYDADPGKATTELWQTPKMEKYGCFH